MDRDVYRTLAEVQAKHWWYEARRRILRSLIATLPLPRRARILEVGCGSGANLAMLKEFGTVEGVEPDPFAREWARGLSGCVVEDGMLPDGLAAQGPFDMVCAFDVIEHVEADVESLAALYRLTAPGGYALFAVPAFTFLWSGHDDVNHHFRRYTRPVFAAKLRQVGFTIEKISYYNTFLFPLVAAYRLARKKLVSEKKLDTAIPPPAINLIFEKIFSAEAHLLKFISLPFGVSLLAVCRRAPDS